MFSIIYNYSAVLVGTYAIYTIYILGVIKSQGI